MTDRETTTRDQQPQADAVTEEVLLERLQSSQCYPIIEGNLQGSKTNARALKVIAYPIPAIDIVLDTFEPQEHLAEMKEAGAGTLQVRLAPGWKWAYDHGRPDIRMTPNNQVVIVTEEEEIPAGVLCISNGENSEQTRFFLIRN